MIGYINTARSTSFGHVWLSEWVVDGEDRIYRVYYEHGPDGNGNPNFDVTERTQLVIETRDVNIAMVAYAAIHRMLEQIDVVQNDTERLMQYVAKQAFPFNLKDARD
jgi:hypothetical protein